MSTLVKATKRPMKHPSHRDKGIGRPGGLFPPGILVMTFAYPFRKTECASTPIKVLGDNRKRTKMVPMGFSKTALSGASRQQSTGVARFPLKDMVMLIGMMDIGGAKAPIPRRAAGEQIARFYKFSGFYLPALVQGYRRGRARRKCHSGSV